MNAYVGARLAEAPLVRTIQNLLLSKGFQISYDWTTAGNLRGNEVVMRQLAPQMVKACFEADLSVLLIATGEQTPQRGLHVELGATLAGGGRVVLWTPPEHGYIFDPGHKRCIAFYAHPAVTRLAVSRENLPIRLLEVI